MNQENAIPDLIHAFKKGDQKLIDRIIGNFITTAEKRKQYKLAKKLREAYSVSSVDNAPVFFQPSSVQNIISGNGHLFEIRKSINNLDQIILSSTNKNVLLEIIENYKKKDVLKKHGLANDSRLILYGPPGTGKTLFAYVLAGELNLPIYHVYLDTLVSSFLGETGKNLKLIFDEASKKECVLLLDEFDAIAKHRDDSQELGELKRVVTVLLQNIDNLNPNTILVAATNHEHLLDSAVWRRFDYSLKLDILDASSRKSLLNLFLSDNKDIDIKLLLNLSEGLSGAIIRQIINRSLRKNVLAEDGNLQQQLIENFLIANASHSERLKGQRRDSLILAIKSLRKLDEQKYTYEELERITGLPSSTLHHLNTKI
jgi:SpoVK/Ycf46/Vps4 family AAA+-type ATPase